MTGNHEKAKMLNSAAYGKCKCTWHVEPHGEIIPEYEPDCPDHGQGGHKHMYRLYTSGPWFYSFYCWGCGEWQGIGKKRFWGVNK